MLPERTPLSQAHDTAAGVGAHVVQVGRHGVRAAAEVQRVREPHSWLFPVCLCHLYKHKWYFHAYACSGKAQLPGFNVPLHLRVSALPSVTLCKTLWQTAALLVSNSSPGKRSAAFHKDRLPGAPRITTVHSLLCWSSQCIRWQEGLAFILCRKSQRWE